MYTYDLGGNMTSEDVIGRGSGARSSQVDMTYTGGNQTEYWNGQEIEFDQDGNMTWGPLEGALASYEYNELNQLIRAGSTSFGYDGEGRRIWQTDGGGSELRYITNPNASLSQLLVMQGSDGSSTYYVYGNGLISQEHFTPEGEAEYRIFHYDYRGSTKAMTDLDSRVTDRVTYDPYGRITSREGSTETIFLYVGQWGVQADNNGLLYMRARYYSTDLNRFINEDPIEDGLNWYAYANNNPITMIDVDGLRGVKRFVVRGEPNSSILNATASVVQNAAKMAHYEEVNKAWHAADMVGSKAGATAGRSGTSGGSKGSGNAYAHYLILDNDGNSTGIKGKQTPFTEKYIDFIKEYETHKIENGKFVLTNSGQTIAYGHDLKAGESYTELTLDQGYNLMLDDLNSFYDELDRRARLNGINLDDFEVYEVEALVDFMYNRYYGLVKYEENMPNSPEIKYRSIDYLLLATTAGDDEKIIEILKSETLNTKGVHYDGLERRRMDEYEIYKNINYIRDDDLNRGIW